MKKLWLVCVFFGMQYIAFSQNCNVTEGIAEIKSQYSQGAFKDGLEVSSELLKCETLSNADRVQILVWEYKLNRDSLKGRLASEAILKAKELLEEKAYTLDFKLLLLENFALRRMRSEYQKLEGPIENLIAALPENDHYNRGRFYLAKHYGMDGDRFPVERVNILRKALDNFDKIEDPPVYYLGNTLRALGNYNRTTGDFDKSAGYYQRELELYKTVYPEDHFNLSICNYNLGGVFYEKLEYQRALDHFLAAHTIWKDTYKQDSFRMRTLNEAIGDMYWELDDHEKALEYFNYATPFEKQINNDLSENTLTVADSLLDLGNYASAMDYYREAVKWREKTYGKDHMLTGACKNFVGRAHMSAGENKEALDAYQQAITILVEEFTDTSWYANPDLNMNIQSGQYLLEALTAKGNLLKELYMETKELDDLKTALSTQELAISLLEKIKNNEMSASSKSFWTQKTIDLVESTLDTAWILMLNTEGSAYKEKAFDYVERSKALLLLASLYDQENTRFANIPQDLLEKERTLKRDINEYSGRIETEEKRCADVREKMLKLYTSKLQSLQDQYDLLIGDIARDHPNYYKLKYDVDIASVEMLRERLVDDRTNLISYFSGVNSMYVFNLSSDGLTIRRYSTPEFLRRQTIELLGLMRNNSEMHTNSVPDKKRFTELSYGVYQSAIQGEIEQVPEGNSLIIVPDGYLAYLPFESLVTEPIDPLDTNYRDMPYLFQKHPISYSPSASIALLNEETKGNRNNYLGFAPDYKNEKDSDLRKKPANLMFNQSEVEFGNMLFSGQSWRGESVTEDLLKMHSEEAGIVHLAMHGEVEDEHPLLSRLFFNVSEEEDGLLHIYEIYNLHMPAELVILSACNTASGKLQRGEGIMSMERAFQYAGSRSLLATLWSVDDASSAQITQLFLENLKEGLPKNVALQQAKKTFLETANP